jgi:type II secretory pathway pseudopilin PulG
MSYRAGFFLEIIVATCLVASLSAAAVPPLARHLDTARDTVLAYNVRVLQQTIEIFAVREGHYPACLTELVEEGYLYSLPVNPRTGRPDFCYNPATGEIGTEPSPTP